MITIENLQIGKSYNCIFETRVEKNKITESNLEDAGVSTPGSFSGWIVLKGRGDIEGIDPNTKLLKILERGTRKEYVVHFDDISDIQEGSICALEDNAINWLPAEQMNINGLLRWKK
jgi:hypothetical protein